jgi:hypothetical protein
MGTAKTMTSTCRRQGEEEMKCTTDEVAGINILKNFIPRINHIPIGELIAKM